MLLNRSAQKEGDAPLIKTNCNATNHVKSFSQTAVITTQPSTLSKKKIVTWSSKKQANDRNAKDKLVAQSFRIIITPPPPLINQHLH
jgi:hypothetical protein